MHKKAGKPNYEHKVREIHNRVICFKFTQIIFTFSPKKQKLRQFFFQKITTAAFFCDESQFSWVATENIIPMQMSFYEITSKQVLWLAPYRLNRPHFCILPSRFPNDYLSITDTKTFDAHTDSLTVGDSHPIPFPPIIPRCWVCSIIDTLCECIKLRTSYSLHFSCDNLDKKYSNIIILTKKQYCIYILSRSL